MREEVYESKAGTTQREEDALYIIRYMCAPADFFLHIDQFRQN